MRCIWLVCLAAGCDFAVTAPSGGGDDQGQGPGPGGVDAGTPAMATCDVTGDSSLQLCLTFDHEPMVQDLSSYAHAITDVTGVTRIDRDLGSSAVSLTAASRLHV